MAWGWSHTAEAYENARENVNSLPRSDLLIIYAEWKAYMAGKEADPQDHEPFDEQAYFEVLSREESLRHGLGTPCDIMADCVWEWMEQQAICDNGGFRAWACPYGCHTVSFDKRKG